uniref:Uncharacterized protein n=1 Tax=Gasterosteus aculeatus aculeatus TaxID=481459 RepID=A0AAQ4RGS3_GASAC
MVDKNIYIVQGEIGTVVGAIKRNSRWNTHTPLDEEQDPLLNSFGHLKEILNNIKDLQSQISTCRGCEQWERFNTYGAAQTEPPPLLPFSRDCCCCVMDRHCWRRRNPPHWLTLFLTSPPKTLSEP